MSTIPVAGPWVTEKEIAYVVDAARHAWYGEANVYHARFEQAFAAHLGVRYAVALPSCTAAIHLALLALGVGPGDEVVVPEITWIATAAPISYVGATPVFCDIDPVTWCMAADSLEASITRHTKACIPVDLYGGMPDMDSIRAIATRHGVAVVEDAAQAIGSLYKGRPAGSLGDVGVFSFHGSKTLTTGEGGLLATDRSDVYDRVLVLRDHGRIVGEKQFWNGEVAYKYKMSSMQAALGLAQLERLPELIQRKRQIFAWYRGRLGDMPTLTLNAETIDTINSYWMVTAVLDPTLGIQKERLIRHLADRQIASRPFFYPLSSLPAYSAMPGTGSSAQANPVSYRLSPHGINLPSALSLVEVDVDTVCQTLDALVAGASPA